MRRRRSQRRSGVLRGLDDRWSRPSRARFAASTATAAQRTMQGLLISFGAVIWGEAQARSHCGRAVIASAGVQATARQWTGHLPIAMPTRGVRAGYIVGTHHSKHNRILGRAIIRITGEPFIVCCDPKHHRSYLRVWGVFGPRPYCFGSHAPVRCGPEKIVRVGDPLASQNGVLHFP